MRSRLTADDVRQRIDHPVLDGDMHWLEPIPVFLEFVGAVGGGLAADRFRTLFREGAAATGRWHRLSPVERVELGWMRPGWWTFPARTRDYATAALPGLLNERLEEFGIDLAVLYPTVGLGMLSLPDEELRQIGCRAYNRMVSELFAPYADRIAAVAVVPTHTPGEALHELDDAVGERGLKSTVISGHTVRSAQQPVGKEGHYNPSTMQYVDFYGLDSPYDYDPVWQRCVELGVPVTIHGHCLGWMDRRSPTNYVFSHIGLFSNANSGSCKALVLGGVPGRFPALRFAFLEGGVGWAIPLYNDLVGHWAKRNPRAMREHLRPSLLDLEELHSLWRTYAPSSWQDTWGEIAASPVQGEYGITLEELTARDERYDEFEAIGDDVNVVKTWFEEQFYFGCEADDRTVSAAFANDVGITLKPSFGSDIGHWDVPVMNQVLPEAYELVEEGVMTPEQFRAFTCDNVANLYLDMNAEFFHGMAVESRIASA